MKNHIKNPTTMTATAMVAALMLAGCGKPVDTPSAPSERTAQNTVVVPNRPAVSESTAQATREATEATRRAAQDAKDASKNAADQASNKVADALITTSVNAELAKDPKLSSLAIDVDTDNGRVALRGTAPDLEAKERATQITRTVEGVVSVDNQLTVATQRG